MSYSVSPLVERRHARPVSVVIGAGWRSLAVVTDDGELVEAHGPAACRRALYALAGHQVYTIGRPTQLLLTTGAREWCGWTWKGALVRVKLDGGPTIYPVRRAVPDVAPMAAVAGLRVALDWLAGHGVRAGSLGAMAFNLWRASLVRTVRLSGPPVRAALYGGRQEAPYPGDYADCRYHDLGAAYPASMAAEPYPTKLVRISPLTALDGPQGVARATVRLPRLEWCPLPVRVAPGAVCFGWGDATGWWPIRELHMARQAGADVDVHEMWGGVPDTDLFGPWWGMVQQGRRLAGAAGGVVKALTSSLWGQFALEDEGGAMVRWHDDHARHPVRVATSQGRNLPQRAALYVAADTTARVRVRLWREALAVLPDALYCDTDAVVTGFASQPDRSGLDPGQWRVKATMVRCEIRAPQVLRHTCPTCDRDHAAWHYTVAGAPTADAAARVFERSSRAKGQTMAASMAPGDMILPARHLADWSHLAKPA